MSEIGTATSRPVACSCALGLLGGSALIATVSLTSTGPMIYLPYGLLIIATGFFLRHERVQPFSRRFCLALGAFMGASLLLYGFVGLVAARTLFATPLAGHAWRLGLMLGLGGLLSAAVAQVTSTGQRASSEPRTAA